LLGNYWILLGPLSSKGEVPNLASALAHRFKKIYISNYSADLLDFAWSLKSGYIFLNISIWLGAFKNIFLTEDINLSTFINFDRMVFSIPY
jgi:hypothetical protein